MTDDIRTLAQREAMGSPQPPPVAQGEPVTPALLAWLERRGNSARIAAIVEARDAFGRAKYGQPLMSHDGRDVSADFGQEIADALQYGMAARMRGIDLSEWEPMLRALCDMVRPRSDLDAKIIERIRALRE